jgi:diadenosine tetraphosphate (Ap4A) HIT family hydrolase
MPESAAQVHARVVESVGAEGRLPLPPIGEWDVFPWEAVDGAVVPKMLPEPGEERRRMGDEGGEPCKTCEGFDPALVVWEDEHWVLTRFPKPTGLPLVLTLWTREHLDFPDLDDELAAEFGHISTRLVRISEHLPNIGRMHVSRWGDGSSHFHVWFFARTEGLTNVLGSYAVEWDEILPPGPEDVWRDDLHTVATKLGNWGGHPRA